MNNAECWALSEVKDVCQDGAYGGIYILSESLSFTKNTSANREANEKLQAEREKW